MTEAEKRILKNQIDIMWVLHRFVGKQESDLVGRGGELDAMRADLTGACKDSRKLLESAQDNGLKLAQASLMTNHAMITPQTPWECLARKQGTSGGNAPADCDWPSCGCDPYANKVLEAIDEAGFEIKKKA